MLEQFIVPQLYAFLLIFCRTGAGLMVMPGFGEAYVLARARLLLALALALLLTPVIGPHLPPMPAEPSMLVALIAGEILIGLLLGGLARIMLSAAHVAGTIIATQSSLASAMMLDLSHSGQATPITNLLTFVSVILLFVMDMHHLMLRALTDSYSLFTPGVFPSAQDFTEYASSAVSHAFAIAAQLAAPNMVVGIILNLAGGVLARLMPSLQIFFLMMVPQILGSFFVLMAVFSGLMLWYMRYIEDALMPFIAPLPS